MIEFTKRCRTPLRGFLHLIKEEAIKSKVLETAQKIKQSLGIDTRFVVFDCEFQETASKASLKFIVSSSYAENGIREFFSHLPNPIDYTIELLSGNEFGERSGTICNVSVAPVMAQPTDRSEQITQFLLGETADLLQVGINSWIRIRLHADGYIGWVSQNQIVDVTIKEIDAWKSTEKKTSKEFVGSLKAESKVASDPIREILFGTYLHEVKKKAGWSALQLPDGKLGWIKSFAIKVKAKPKPDVLSSEIIASAKRFLGISYLWGGRSVKGFDCSGFTQTVFGLNGIEIPRDASLQSTCGEDVGIEIASFAEGDLLFFSKKENRITHVGIYLGNGKFIHASGFVKINSLYPNDKSFSEKYRSQFVGARRLGE